MSTADKPCDAAPGDDWASLPPLRHKGTEVTVQPVPGAAARLVAPGGLGRDRLRLWSRYGERYRRAMAAVSSGFLRGSHGSADRVSVLADIAAVRLYLDGEWEWLDEAILAGHTGPHLPLARCVASGLRRLPPYRGPAISRTVMTDQITDWYRENPFVVDHGFWTASAGADALGEAGPGILVWSLTGRRIGGIDPAASERLVFSPGTRFKVLHVVEELQQPVVMLREMFPQEPAAHGPAGSEEDPTEWLDTSTVSELFKSIQAPGRESFAPPSAGPRERHPGLIVTMDAPDPLGDPNPAQKPLNPPHGPGETPNEVRTAVRAAWSAGLRERWTTGYRRED
ncbi:hypothetical protein ACIGCZ_35735 [Streptomyces nigra]|uniref:hypothetical protein n=1 Tax=Streptomyces nigra TaxID=1827580 RepID=UPI0037D21EF0